MLREHSLDTVPYEKKRKVIPCLLAFYALLAQVSIERHEALCGGGGGSETDPQWDGGAHSISVGFSELLIDSIRAQRRLLGVSL